MGSADQKLLDFFKGFLFLAGLLVGSILFAFFVVKLASWR